jgi:hypothetical protein
MKKGLIDLYMKDGVEYRGIIVREADGHSVHLNFNSVPSAQFAEHIVQVLNAKNDLLKQKQRAEVVEEFNCDKTKLKARILELNRQAGLPGICKAQCKQGAVH